MNQAPIKEETFATYNKKSLLLIGVLISSGTILGLILSSIYIVEVNTKIQEVADELSELFGDNIPPFIHVRITPLTTSEIILPTLGIIVVCISMFLLIGLIAVYFKIFSKTKSKYILGLFFVLVPLFIESIFLVYTLLSLFSSFAIPAFPPNHGINESFGFAMGGLGQILVIVSLFENIGLCILLYLSNE
jgi:magnesium-transporting ATPase (P-type)